MAGTKSIKPFVSDGLRNVITNAAEFMPEQVRYERYAKWCQDNKYPVAPIEVWRSMSAKIAETNYSWPNK